MRVEDWKILRLEENMRTFALLLIVAVMSLTVGWNFWEGEATDDTAYFPLKVGYKWTYVAKMGDEEKEMEMEVVGTQKIGDVECFAIEAFGGAPLFYAADKEGVKRYKLSERGDNNPQLTLKFPLKNP